jgi:hypothetical protein
LCPSRQNGRRRPGPERQWRNVQLRLHLQAMAE